MDILGHLTSDQAADHLGINRQSLYNLATSDPDFPKPAKVGRASLWPIAELDAWRERHPARGHRQSKSG